ncbi:hypothetical protein SASPL_113850 [Salvia splendens]|uniref:Uncharacterized protein n=1 Tax=Salvia splendens TaxID=180675 RepID=A0A8X8Y2B0_SALSN|nr:hypothetical protein SASPL_113850 [Salvia splendens]
MAKTTAIMLVALFVMSALLSSSWAASEVDSTALPVQSEADPAAEASSGKVFKVCNSVEVCGGEGGSGSVGGGGNRKLLSDAEAPATTMQEVEKGAESLKTKFMGLFQ